MQSLQMSTKDRVIFCSKADHETPSKYELPAPLPSEEKRGVLLPNGEINWTCPCLGGLPYGPCGYEFREFFSCLPQFGKSDQAAVAGSGDAGAGSDTAAAKDDEARKAEECFPKFAAMKACFAQFPKLYPPDEDETTPMPPTSKTGDKDSALQDRT